MLNENNLMISFTEMYFYYFDPCGNIANDQIVSWKMDLLYQF